jgi:hypothetical protein
MEIPTSFSRLDLSQAPVLERLIIIGREIRLD